MESRLFGLAKNYPAGISIAPHQLAETWGVVELATGTAFSVVSDRLGRSTAARAAAFIEDFGDPESVSELGVPLKVQAARRAEAFLPSCAAISTLQAHAPLRVIDGGWHDVPPRKCLLTAMVPGRPGDGRHSVYFKKPPQNDNTTSTYHQQTQGPPPLIDQTWRRCRGAASLCPTSTTSPPSPTPMYRAY